MLGADSVRVKFSPKFIGIKRQGGRALARTWQKVGARIKRRILTQNVDAQGKKLPDLAKEEGRGATWVKADDPRFQGGEIASLRPTKGGEAGKGPVLAVRLLDSYKQAKIRAGAKGQRDAQLTGSLWDSLTVLVSNVRGKPGAIRLKLLFAGSDKNQKYAIDGKTKSGKARTRSLRQRTKAERLMFVERNDKGETTGEQAFLLLEPNEDERALFRIEMLDKLEITNRAISATRSLFGRR